MHAVCKHKYMKNIQMKRTLKILGGKTKKASAIIRKRNPDSEGREKNHQERDKRKRGEEKRSSKCVFNVVTSWCKLSHNAARNKSIY